MRYVGKYAIKIFVLNHDIGWRRPLSNFTGFLLYCSQWGKMLFGAACFLFWPQYLKRPLDKDRAPVRVLTHLSSSLSPSSQESDYFTPQGEFRVDKAGSPTLLNCLMYKMSYYRFGEMQVRPRWTRPVKRSKVVSRWFFSGKPFDF